MVATWKKELVSSLAKSMTKARTVGLVSITGTPSSQFQQMRKSLGNVKIKVTRNNIIRLAIKKAKIEGLEEYVDGPVGVITTDSGPFELEGLLSEKKVMGKLKPGAIAPKDIVIPKGDTPFPPGPIIGDLQKAGIKAKIEGGKIVVTQDSLIVKAGEKVSEDVAGALTRLDIKPVEISLKLNAAYEAGIIYTQDILHIDKDETIGKLAGAHYKALNLALNAGIHNKRTLPLLLQIAFTNARNLCLNAEVINRGTIEFYLSKANAQMNALKTLLPPEVLAASKEEAKPDEKKEEIAEKEEKSESEEKSEAAAAKEDTAKEGEPKQEENAQKETEVKKEVKPEEEVKPDKKPDEERPKEKDTKEGEKTEGGEGKKEEEVKPESDDTGTKEPDKEKTDEPTK